MKSKLEETKAGELPFDGDNHQPIQQGATSQGLPGSSTDSFFAQSRFASQLPVLFNTNDSINTTSAVAIKRPTLAECFDRNRGNRVSRESIRRAVESGSLAAVQEIVEMGADVFPENSYYQMGNNEPIRIAVEKGYLDIAEYLLSQGSISNNSKCVGSLTFGNLRYRCWLEDLAAKDQLDMMELLIKYGADVGGALQTAGNAFHITMEDSKRLLADSSLTQVQKDKLNQIRLEAKQHYQKVYRILFDYAQGCGFTNKKSITLPFPYLRYIDISGFNFIGVSIDGVPVTKEKLRQSGCTGADNALVTLDDLARLEDIGRREKLENRLKAAMNREGQLISDDGVVNLVPLFYAAKSGDVPVVQTRLMAGANPNLHPYGKYSPIYYAAQNGHHELVTMLALHPEIKDEDVMEALNRAKEKKQVEIAEFLSSRLGTEARGEGGNTPLLNAVRHSDLADVIRLLARGADVNAENNAYETPLVWALKKSIFDNTEDKIQILKLLLDNQAKIKKDDIKEAAKSSDPMVFSLVVEAAKKQNPNWQELISSDILFSILDSNRQCIAKLEILKSNGIRFDCQNPKGNSLLHKSLKLLIAAAADVVYTNLKEFNSFPQNILETTTNKYMLRKQSSFYERLQLVDYLSDEGLRPSQINSRNQDCLSLLFTHRFHFLPVTVLDKLFDNFIKDRTDDRNESLGALLNSTYTQLKGKIQGELGEIRSSYRHFDRRSARALEQELTVLNRAYQHLDHLCKEAGQKMQSEI
ncbi:ankyrin repeat domain-containing protein [Legionella sp. CNM-4043-24]|uniref:ankyrin repeat domain-containing protein n=1 Tax=Legionella sp. CNM-4043-24 TaxID=3421646 RepID=UPI00403B3797